MIQKTKEINQTESQSIFKHHSSVWKYTVKFLTGNIENLPIPKWYSKYKNLILNNTHDYKTIKHYCLHHDIGKINTLSFDENGKRHFHGHVAESVKLWNELFPERLSERNLIENDMLFHTSKFEDIIFKNLGIRDICTLLISALAELHSNCQMFGGYNSESYKIKFKRLEKLGNKICDHIFSKAYVYVIVRKDLSKPQQIVQSCHAILNATKEFGHLCFDHPSVIVCSAKNENELLKFQNYLKKNSIKLCIFNEPDIGDKPTALATMPLFYDLRNYMKRFQLIKE